MRLRNRLRTGNRALRLSARLLAGRDRASFAELLLDEAEVAAHLPVYLRAILLSTRSLGVPLADGEPDRTGLAAVRERLLSHLGFPLPK